MKKFSFGTGTMNNSFPKTATNDDSSVDSNHSDLSYNNKTQALLQQKQLKKQSTQQNTLLPGFTRIHIEEEDDDDNNEEDDDDNNEDTGSIFSQLSYDSLNDNSVQPSIQQLAKQKAVKQKAIIKIQRKFRETRSKQLPGNIRDDYDSDGVSDVLSEQDDDARSQVTESQIYPINDDDDDNLKSFKTDEIRQKALKSGMNANASAFVPKLLSQRIYGKTQKVDDLIAASLKPSIINVNANPPQPPKLIPKNPITFRLTADKTDPNAYSILNQMYHKGLTVSKNDTFIYPNGDYKIYNKDSTKFINLMYVVDTTNLNAVGYIRKKYVEQDTTTKTTIVFKLKSEYKNVRLRLMAKFEDPSFEKNDLIDGNAYRGLIVNKESKLVLPSNPTPKTFKIDSKEYKILQKKNNLDAVGYICKDDYENLTIE